MTEALTKIAGGRADLVDMSEVMCPICLSILIEPVTMPCSHVLCRPCFTENINQATLCCPLCRARIGSWCRRATKDGRLVDQKLWNFIKDRFDGAVEARISGSGDDEMVEEMFPCLPTHTFALEGEVRKEFEDEKERLFREEQEKKDEEERLSAQLVEEIAREEEMKVVEMREQEAKDKEVARRLWMETPSLKPTTTITPTPDKSKQTTPKARKVQSTPKSRTANTTPKSRTRSVLDLSNFVVKRKISELSDITNLQHKCPINDIAILQYDIHIKDESPIKDMTNLQIKSPIEDTANLQLKSPIEDISNLQYTSPIKDATSPEQLIDKCSPLTKYSLRLAGNMLAYSGVLKPSSKTFRERLMEVENVSESSESFPEVFTVKQKGGASHTNLLNGGASHTNLLNKVENIFMTKNVKENRTGDCHEHIRNNYSENETESQRNDFLVVDRLNSSDVKIDTTTKSSTPVPNEDNIASNLVKYDRKPIKEYWVLNDEEENKQEKGKLETINKIITGKEGERRDIYSDINMNEESDERQIKTEDPFDKKSVLKCDEEKKSSNNLIDNYLIPKPAKESDRTSTISPRIKRFHQMSLKTRLFTPEQNLNSKLFPPLEQIEKRSKISPYDSLNSPNEEVTSSHLYDNPEPSGSGIQRQSSIFSKVEENSDDDSDDGYFTLEKRIRQENADKELAKVLFIQEKNEIETDKKIIVEKEHEFVKSINIGSNMSVIADGENDNIEFDQEPVNPFIELHSVEKNRPEKKTNPSNVIYNYLIPKAIKKSDNLMTISPSVKRFLQISRKSFSPDKLPSDCDLEQNQKRHKISTDDSITSHKGITSPQSPECSGSGLKFLPDEKNNSGESENDSDDGYFSWEKKTSEDKVDEDLVSVFQYQDKYYDADGKQKNNYVNEKKIDESVFMLDSVEGRKQDMEKNETNINLIDSYCVPKSDKKTDNSLTTSPGVNIFRQMSLQSCSLIPDKILKGKLKQSKIYPDESFDSRLQDNPFILACGSPSSPVYGIKEKEKSNNDTESDLNVDCSLIEKKIVQEKADEEMARLLQIQMNKNLKSQFNISDNIKARLKPTESPSSSKGLRLCSKRHKLLPCKVCPSCLQSNCGKCTHCRDMPQFGGRGVAKQRCVFRRCIKPIRSSCSSCNKASKL